MIKMPLLYANDAWEACLLDAEARKKFRVVKFGAEWCGPCKRIIPAYANLAKLHGSVDFLQVDIEAEPSFAEELSIAGLPTFVGFVDRVEKSRMVGADEKALESWVSRLLENAGCDDKCSDN
jgi:thioredoxin 1